MEWCKTIASVSFGKRPTIVKEVKNIPFDFEKFEVDETLRRIRERRIELDSSGGKGATRKRRLIGK